MPLSAVFHTSSLQKQVAALSDAFAIAGEFLHCDVINSGHINMTFRATYRKPDGTTRRYIFQRVNDAVFPCPRDVMHNVEKVTNHIRWKMLRVLKTPFRQTLNLYYVSLKGVTGSGALDTAAVEQMLPRIRQHVHIPVGVGFGIRDAATAQAIGKVADAVVIGSRIIQLIEDQEHAKVVPMTMDFLRGVRKALDA